MPSTYARLPSFFFSSRRRHTRSLCDWSSDVCSSDLDEFQNVTTSSIPGILSEARKYKLSLAVAHQFLSQIEEKTRDAVFGNVGNVAEIGRASCRERV